MTEFAEPPGKTQDWTPERAQVTTGWLQSLKAKDRVRVFYRFRGQWFVKEFSISTINLDGKINISAAGRGKLEGTGSGLSGFFSQETGMRVFGWSEDQERTPGSEYDFIAPIADIDLADAVFLPQGISALSWDGAPAEPEAPGEEATADDSAVGEPGGDLVLDSERRMPWEYAEDYQRYLGVKEWFSEVENYKSAGALWLPGGAHPIVLLSIWLRHYAKDNRGLVALLPSECGIAELLYRLLKGLHDSKVVDLDRFLGLTFSQSMDFRSGRLSPYPKEASERRQLLERIYGQDERLRRIKIVLDGAENLLPKALKEVVYLNQSLGCPFILLGNEDLEPLVKTAKSALIQFSPISGYSFDPEFIDQLVRHHERLPEAAKKDRLARTSEVQTAAEDEELTYYGEF